MRSQDNTFKLFLAVVFKTKIEIYLIQLFLNAIFSLQVAVVSLTRTYNTGFFVAPHSTKV